MRRDRIYLAGLEFAVRGWASGAAGREIKNDAKVWKRIPVVVLTTSSNETDIFITYNLHANCYISKPVDFTHPPPPPA